MDTTDTEGEGGMGGMPLSLTMVHAHCSPLGAQVALRGVWDCKITKIVPGFEGQSTEVRTKNGSLWI